MPQSAGFRACQVTVFYLFPAGAWHLRHVLPCDGMEGDPRTGPEPGSGDADADPSLRTTAHATTTETAFRFRARTRIRNGASSAAARQLTGIVVRGQETELRQEPRRIVPRRIANRTRAGNDDIRGDAIRSEQAVTGKFKSPTFVNQELHTLD